MAMATRQPTETYKELRPLGKSNGLLEKYSAARSHLGIYNNVCVTAIYNHRGNDDVKHDLRVAVTAVIAQHPILSAVPVDLHTESPRFVSLPSIDLEKNISFRPSKTPIDSTGFDSELQSILESQHNRPFGHSERLDPFWRLEIIDDGNNSQMFAVCLCFHHSLMDTKSAIVFHEQLEKALNGPTPRSAGSDGLLPPLESVCKLSTSEEFIKQASAPTEPPENVWSGARQRLPVETRVRLFWISDELTNNFRKACKRGNASVTSGLMALLSAAFFENLPGHYDTLQGDCAVSLRHLLPRPIDDQSLGCYVGSFSQTYFREPESIWSAARRTKKTIDEVATRDGADMPVGYLSHVADDMLGWLAGKLGKRRAAAWEISNVGGIGSIKNKGESRYETERLLFSQSASACSGAVKVSVVTGRDEKLGFAFSWQVGIVEDGLVEKILSTFKDLLVAMGTHAD